MSDQQSRWCVFIPCSSGQSWAVPQGCLAEIVTLQTEAEQPPTTIQWRGEVVPVMDMGGPGDPPWRDERTGTGLVAVVLGLEGEGCDYWGIAVRGHGLGVRELADGDIEDLPEAVEEHACAAFRLEGVVYQVPDLPALQQAIPSRQGLM